MRFANPVVKPTLLIFFKFYFQFLRVMALNLYYAGLYEQCLASITAEKKRGTTYKLLYIEGLALRALNRITEAINSFLASQKLNPLDQSTTLELAKCFYLQGNYTSVIAQCDSILSAENKAPWLAHQLRGLASFRIGDRQAAEKHLFLAYDLHPTLQAKQLIGGLQAAAGKMQDAITTMNDIISLSPESINVLIDLGLLYVRMNSLDNAFECFSRAVIAVQKQMACRSNMTLSTPQDSFIFSPAFFSLGYAIQAKDPRTALLKYRVAAGLKLDNRDPHMWANLAYIFVSLSNFEAALVCATRAFRLDSVSEPCRRALGHVYVCMGDYCRAFQILSPAMGDTRAHESQWLLGIAAAKLGELRVAMACLSKAADGGVYGACLTGLLVFLQANDLTTAAQFSVKLKEMDPDCDENLRQGKAAIKRLRKLVQEENAAAEGQLAPEKSEQPATAND